MSRPLEDEFGDLNRHWISMIARPLQESRKALAYVNPGGGSPVSASDANACSQLHQPGADHFIPTLWMARDGVCTPAHARSFRGGQRVLSAEHRIKIEHCSPSIKGGISAKAHIGCTVLWPAHGETIGKNSELKLQVFESFNGH